jgi:precorrin-3B synthase
MQTGDGLLVRLLPIDAIPLAAFAGLCAAARTHGNGIVEVTARGSIQVRGLAPASAPRFAAAVGALGIAANDGVAVHTNPLAGVAGWRAGLLAYD